MAERGRARARAAAKAIEIATRARRAAASYWVVDRTDALTDRLRAWIAAESAPGRLVPWIPVAFGFGVVLYFTADREPQLWAGAGLAIALGATAFAARRRHATFSALILMTAVAAGFSVVTLKSVRLAHPVLQRPLFDAAITGWVEAREERERTDRILVAVHGMEARRMEAPLERVRVSVRKGLAPPVGSFVSFKARLSPPLAPLRPGGYDFARDLYFQGIGATGFAQGEIRRIEAPHAPASRLRFAASVAGIRDAIDARIRAALPGDVGAIASALITGKRDAISAPVNEAMYVSSLAHVLSISGYHMAVVAGVVFFVLRALFALSPMLALRYPIKKWSAFGALAAASAYLILSGAEVATQRAYIMTAVVLIGVMLDRAALTLRTLAVAACGVLLVAPEAVVHPSFQMSFAATLALVAAYEKGVPWVSASAETSRAARIALWGGREIVALVLVSIVAGLATTLFAAYHFHRLAPYGVIANLAAMPIVSAWVMPMGLLALLAAPFGFDGFLWGLMGQGIDWMIGVALWVARMPGAVGRIAAFGIGPLLLGTASLLLLCLLRSPLRWSGAVLGLVAVGVALRTPQPDVLVAPGGEAVAVRAAEGRLAILKVGNDSFAIRDWLAADADARSAGDPNLRRGFTCDETACVANLAGGKLVSVVLTPEAFEEDCARVALVVTRRTAPPFCAAQVIDRTVWPRTGALALYRDGEGFKTLAARPETYRRPWTRAEPSPPAGTAATPGLASRDATPREADVQAEE